jgi:hypothetical protein
MDFLCGRYAKMFGNRIRLSTCRFEKMIWVGNARKFVMKMADDLKPARYFLSHDFLILLLQLKEQLA